MNNTYFQSSIHVQNEIAVYRLDNGVIQTESIRKMEILRSKTLPKCQCTAE